MAQYEVHQEKRFAVVMYGGVSLAIYINGVAQELLRLVRSTAKGVTPSTSGTEGIYRELAEELHARFVIDIITGTSAGGINGVFLAKALANALPFDQLEQLWLDEGDIDKLLNDKQSMVEGLKTDFKRPRSLLNGKRMYQKLLDALDNMDSLSDPGLPAAGTASPGSYVKELDLFVTATDLQGQKTPIRLFDKIVYERRHRNVFRFNFSKEYRNNDFKKDNNPFLAFAARCTSSFPFAFEPMRLVDITGAKLKTVWREFFRGYLLGKDQVAPDRRNGHGDELLIKKGDFKDKYDTFSPRSFADGGYLDNKPFSYAIETIALRHSDVPVDRKLLYIEPSPEIVPDDLDIAGPPNAVENTAKAFSLARYETIREDLQQVTARNRLIERVGRILDGTLKDIQRNDHKRQPDSVDNWLGKDLKSMIEQEGVSYGGYLRLRVAKLTDDLTEIITRQAGFDAESGLFMAVNYIVRAWRDGKYAFYEPEKKNREKFTQFLYDFNLSFFIRRLNFTIANIDRFYRMAGGIEDLPDVTVTDQEKMSNPLAEVQRLRAEGQVEPFIGKLSKIRKLLSYRLVEINRLKAFLNEPADDSVLTEAISELNLNARWITDTILSTSSGTPALEAARNLVEQYTAQLEKVANIIKNVVQRADKHTYLCKRELNLGKLVLGDKTDEELEADLITYLKDNDFKSKKKDSESKEKDFKTTAKIKLAADELQEKCPRDPVNAAIWVSAYYFRRFSYYDLVAFPIMQAAEIGDEIDPVDIIRISPDDATALSAAGERKLGGATLMHFGAFLDRTWRKNDILWGRLDGAERIITALVAGTALEKRKDDLIELAHHAILEETFLGDPKTKKRGIRRRKGRENLDLLTAAVLGKSKRERDSVWDKLDKIGTRKKIKELIDKLLKGNLQTEEIYCDYFKDYEADREINPRAALKIISRSTRVVGKLLDGISEEQTGAGLMKRVAAWLVRLGRLLWGLVEVSTPNTIFYGLAGYWLYLLLLISVLMTLGGELIIKNAEVRNYGLLLFLIVVVFFMARSVLRKALDRKFTSLSVIKNFIISLLTLFVVGVLISGFINLPDTVAKLMSWIGGYASP